MRGNLDAINNNVIVYMEEQYESTITAPGGTKFHVNNAIDDTTYLIRHGEVVTSSDPRFKVGDEVYFHHNCVRRHTTAEGRKERGENEIMDNMFRVEVSYIYLIKRNGEYMAVDPWCYVSPVEKKKHMHGCIELVDNEEYERQFGEMVYTNESLREQGVENGDSIIFNLDSEYQFKVDDRVLYRMKTPWIIGKLKDV